MRNFWAYLQELNRSQWLPREELEGIQFKRLNMLLKHACENVPYYQRKFQEAGLKPDDIKSIDDLTKLPILTKDDIRANLEDLIATNFPMEAMAPYSTGGSTGEPLHFYVTKRCKDWGSAAEYRALSWYGYEPGNKIAYLWGSPLDLSAQQARSRALRNLVLGRVWLNAFDMSPEQMSRFARKLIKFKPRVLSAYTAAAYLFARYIKEQGIKAIRPKAVITQAEQLFDHQRELIREAFACDVFDVYGSRELSTLATECPEHTGYHIPVENVVLEFIRGHKHVSPGETGKVIATDLHNYAMPFIRYQSEDLGVPSDKTCPCGRGLPLMESIEGRVLDNIVTHGKVVSAAAITTLFKDFPINQYQVIQESRGEILVKIVRRDEYSGADSERLLQKLHNHIGAELVINITIVDSILPEKSGKRRFIISKVPTRF